MSNLMKPRTPLTSPVAVTAPTHRPPRLAYLPALCLLPLLMLPGLARAAVTCTGWGSATQNVALGLPSTVDIPLNATAGTVLASGNATLPPALRCTDTSTGQDVTTTSWSWSGSQGYDSTTDSILLLPGIGLQLSAGVTGGGGGQLPASGGTVNRNGFNWTSLSWQLVRTGGAIGPGQSTFGTIGQGQLAAGGNLYLMNIQQTAPVNVTTACVLSTDKSTVQLPDTDTDVLSQAGVSNSAALTAYVTCPANVRVFSTLTMSTTAADTTDNTLVGNTGQAKGVAIEVLDGSGNRVSAQGGTVKLPRFTQGSSTAAPGASQALSVRMVHLSGQPVIPGTVQGTFTLTLTVN
ncbi:fimbrial protein [Enterobacter vonholyi]